MSNVNEGLAQFEEAVAAMPGTDKELAGDLVKALYDNRKRIDDNDKRLEQLGLKIKYLDTAEGQTFFENVTQEMKQFRDDINAQREEHQKQLEAHAETLVKLQRSPLQGGSPEKIEEKQVEVFSQILRKMGSAGGDLGKLSDAEREMKFVHNYDMHNDRPFMEEKALQTDNLARAGFLMMPSSLSKMIIDTNLQEITAIRPYVTNYRIPNPSLTIPVITDPGQAGWFQEGGDDLEEDESFKGGTVDLKPHGSYAYFAIDRHMLMYSYIPLLPMMKDMYMRQFSRLHGAGFVNGSGVQRPFGFMNDTKVEVIDQGHGTLILNLDKVQELWWKLKSFYKENAKFIMNSMTGYVLANLKDGIGNYILRPITENQKFNICGKQVIFSEDMPDIGPGTHPIFIADWKPYYHVIESTGGNWAIEDQFTKKKKSIIEYVFTKFIGGRPVVSEAAKKLRIAV